MIKLPVQKDSQVMYYIKRSSKYTYLNNVKKNEITLKIFPHQLLIAGDILI